MPKMSAASVLGKFRAELPSLSPSFRAWLEEHLLDPPRWVSLASVDDGSGMREVWLITDHTGIHDSPCRLAYAEEEDRFGVEQTLENGVEWFMGVYHSLEGALDSM